MAAQICAAGPIGLPARQSDSFKLIGEELLKVSRNLVVRHEQAVVVGHPDEVAVEEPVNGARERQAVLDDVGTAIRYRPDMGGLHL